MGREMPQLGGSIPIFRTSQRKMRPTDLSSHPHSLFLREEPALQLLLTSASLHYLYKSYFIVGNCLFALLRLVKFMQICCFLALFR